MLKAEAIPSIKDPRVVEARELTSATGRTRNRKCLLEGEESIQWALDSSVLVEHVFYHPASQNEALLTKLRERGIACLATTEGVLKKISDTSYLVPYIGVAQLPVGRSLDEYRTEKTGDLLIVLDHVVDHGNIGTIIRTASAFGVRSLVSTSPELDIYYKKIITASRGKVFDVQFQPFSSGAAAIDTLKRKGYQIVATSPYARDIQAMATLQSKPIALVVGNETEGITDEVLRLADMVVQIPMGGPVESLNVGVATGISLYELKFRMVLMMLTRYIRSIFGREVNVTGKMIMQAFDVQLKQASDLGAWQVVLLMMLKCDEVMPMEQVGRETSMFGQELINFLQPLLDKKYIQHITSNDKNNAIKLTDEGERALAQLWGVVEQAENQVLAGFSANEKEQLNSFLARIQANCSDIINI
jgi:TrmH family RNA methyltransferase